jgi:hypothetical protein
MYGFFIHLIHSQSIFLTSKRGDLAKEEHVKENLFKQTSSTSVMTSNCCASVLTPPKNILKCTHLLGSVKLFQELHENLPGVPEINRAMSPAKNSFLIKL